MRQMLPVPAEVEPYEAYRPDRSRPTLLRVNMVVSVDGAATDRLGRSGGLGAAGDLEVFRALRALADGIVVGAGTVRAEGYGPHRPRPELRTRRAADGRPGTATLVVVSRSLNLDFGSPLFTEAESPTVVLTCSTAPPDRLRAAERAARLLVAGADSVDLAAGLALLRERLGLAQLLCEGGPALNAALFAAGLVDELCLTLAPQLVGASGPRLLHGLPRPVPLHLEFLGEHEGELFARYGVPGPGRAGQNSRSSPESAPRSAS